MRIFTVAKSLRATKRQRESLGKFLRPGQALRQVIRDQRIIIPGGPEYLGRKPLARGRIGRLQRAPITTPPRVAPSSRADRPPDWSVEMGSGTWLPAAASLPAEALALPRPGVQVQRLVPGVERSLAASSPRCR